MFKKAFSISIQLVCIYIYIEREEAGWGEDEIKRKVRESEDERKRERGEGEREERDREREERERRGREREKILEFEPPKCILDSRHQLGPVSSSPYIFTFPPHLLHFTNRSLIVSLSGLLLYLPYFKLFDGSAQLLRIKLMFIPFCKKASHFF